MLPRVMRLMMRHELPRGPLAMLWRLLIWQTMHCGRPIMPSTR
jgi:hypothetical protein